MMALLECALRWSSVGAICVLLLVGCSPQAYKDPVDAWAGSATAGVTAFRALLSAQQESRYAEFASDTVMAGNRVVIPAGCGIRDRATGERRSCNVESSRRGSAQTIALSSSPIAPHAEELIDGITLYAQGLQRLVASEDISKLNDQISALNAALAGLSGTIAQRRNDAPAVAEIEKVSGPISAIVVLVGRTILEQQRVTAMRRAVGAARSQVNAASDLLRADAVDLVDAIMNQQAILLRRRAEHVNRLTGYSQREAAVSLARDSAALTQMGRNRAERTFEKMKESHEALVAALNDQSISFSTLMEKIREFASAANDLKVALDALRRGE